MFGMSIYIKQTFSDQGWSAVFSTGAVWVGIFAGLFMVIVSFLGCYAARKNKKMLLCWYLICVGALFAIQVAAAALLIGYANSFTALSSPSATKSADIATTNDAYVNNALLSLYTICCSGCPVAGITAFSGGQVKTCYAGYPSTYAVCPNAGTASSTCIYSSPCTAAGQNNCWAYGPSNYVYNQNGGLSFPPVKMDPTFCAVLKGVSTSGKPLVGAPSVGGCGGGNPGAFRSNINDYFGPKLYFAGVVFALIAVIQGSVIFVCVYVICFVSKRDVTGDDDD